MRESECVSLPVVVDQHESEALPFIHSRLDTVAVIHKDEGTGWNAMHAGWETHRINHSVAFSDKETCTNQAESFFSRLRRMEVGTHNHIAGPYLGGYVGEATWREHHRRVDNGRRTELLGVAATASPSLRRWPGYWQRAMGRGSPA